MRCVAARDRGRFGSPVVVPRACVVVALAQLAYAGCTVGESGIRPPTDRIFLPGALTVDQTSRFLFVVNSNSDLRFNGGTLTALDLQAAAADRGLPWPVCPPGTLVPRGERQRQCCRDSLDPRVLNCDERPYTRDSVRLGSFGADLVSQPFALDGQPGQARERLFVGVRADPSITAVDVTVSGDSVTLQCAGQPFDPSSVERHHECDEPFKLTAGIDAEALRNQAEDPTFDLPEEPFDLTLDAGLGLLYVGHLSSSLETISGRLPLSGITLVDTCGADRRRMPKIVSFNTPIFGLGADTRGVGTIALAEPGNPLGAIYATARFTSDIGELFLEGTGRDGCHPTAPEPRDLRLVPARSVVETAFAPRGADVRGLVVDSARGFAYALHRNSDYRDRNVSSSTAALVKMDIRPDEFGRRRFAPVRTLEVAGGPVGMILHDAGRGPRLLITCFDAGQIWVVDPERLEATGVVDVGGGPAALAIAAGDPSKAYVATFADNDVAVVDLTPGSPSELQVVQRLGFPRRAEDNVFE